MNELVMPIWKHARLAYVLVIIFWLIYAVLTLFAPSVASNRFHLSHTTLLLLQLTIIIPIHLIWLAAIRGTIALKNYSIMIQGGRESGAISQIANGLLFTISYLILNAVFGALAPFFFGTPAYDPTVVTRDHIAPIFSLISFTLIYRGSHRLRDIAGFATWTSRTFWIMAGYVIFAGLFVLEFATSSVLGGNVVGHNSASIVPHQILLFTLIVPLLSAWFMGIVATINITKYARHVKGSIYRQALKDLVKGLLLVLGFCIIIQIFTFAAVYMATLKIGSLLGIIYLLLLLYGIGFLLIRSGSHKLARIEATQ